MIHGGSRRRRQKMAQRLQTGAQGVGPTNGSGPSVTATSTNEEETPELGADLGKNKAAMAGAVALGSVIALASL